MAAIASTTRQSNRETPEKCHDQDRPPAPPSARAAPSRSALLPSTAHQLQLAHRTAMPAVTKSRSERTNLSSNRPLQLDVTLLHPRSNRHYSTITTHQSRRNQSPTPPIRIHRNSHKRNTCGPLQSPTFAHFASRALRGTNHFANHATRSLATSHEPQVTSRGRSNRHTSRLENAISRRKQTLGTPF